MKGIQKLLEILITHYSFLGAFTYYVSREGGGRGFVRMLTLVMLLMGNDSNLAEEGVRGSKTVQNLLT